MYPEVKLAEAREKRDLARKMLNENIDPSAAKKTSKQILMLAAENSFETIACEWHAKFASSWSEGHALRILSRLQNDIFPES